MAGWDRGLGVTPLILLELPPHYPFITQQSKQHFNWQPSDTEVREKKAQHIVSIMWSSSGRSGLSPLSDQPPQSNGSWAGISALVPYACCFQVSEEIATILPNTKSTFCSSPRQQGYLHSLCLLHFDVTTAGERALGSSLPDAWYLHPKPVEHSLLQCCKAMGAAADLLWWQCGLQKSDKNYICISQTFILFLIHHFKEIMIVKASCETNLFSSECWGEAVHWGSSGSAA